MKGIISDGEDGHAVEERGDPLDTASHIGTPQLEMTLPVVILEQTFRQRGQKL
jgi:hypothetical protein